MQQQQEPQQQASSPQTPKEQALEEYIPEGDSDERREQLAEQCICLIEEYRKKGKLGIGVRLYCGGSGSNAISGWNLYVSENRSEELAAAKANGESPIQESIGEWIKRYSNTYDAEAHMIYTQKAERHNLDTGLKGYVAPHDMTEKACELRLAYVK
ncbi:hypothetical protein BDC45DRAFT_542763 [Circinella umbellata]|nr:hypothetical protein BDC45DRAFT_542763 [Circinella umbellata]